MGTCLNACDIGEIQNFLRRGEGSKWVDRKEIRWGGVDRVHYNDPSVSTKSRQSLNLLAPELFFLILAHSVYKM